MKFYVMAAPGCESLDDQLNIIDRAIEVIDDFGTSTTATLLEPNQLAVLQERADELRQIAGHFEQFKPLLRDLLTPLTGEHSGTADLSPLPDNNDAGNVATQFKIQNLEREIGLANLDLHKAIFELACLNQELIGIVDDRTQEFSPLHLLQQDRVLWGFLRQITQALYLCKYYQGQFQAWSAFDVLERMPAEPTWNEEKRSSVDDNDRFALAPWT